MKIFIFLIGILAFGSSLFAQERPDLKPLSKIPKSMFLIKKAQISNDVGGPLLYPEEKQTKLLKDATLFKKYRLQNKGL